MTTKLFYSTTIVILPSIIMEVTFMYLIPRIWGKCRVTIIKVTLVGRLVVRWCHAHKDHMQGYGNCN